MALRIFDIEAAETRDLTQADLDELLVMRASHGRIMSFLADERVRVLNEIQDARSRHAPAAKEVDNG